MSTICITPRVEGAGGMASFRLKFEQGLRARGVQVTYDLSSPADATLVIAGTRSIASLWRIRRGGGRIMQRLDGINWVHKKRSTGLKHYIRAEYGNFILSLIRRRIATHIIYQSAFSQAWWQDRYGRVKKPAVVIHNGVDLDQYSPVAEKPGLPYKILLVEGSLGGGYEMGLENAIQLARQINQAHQTPCELIVAGKISDAHKAAVQARAGVPIQFLGSLPRAQIPQVMRGAHLLFSADLHPACPNSVIEALACGLPVVSFDTGALKELVIGDAGRIVPYGSNSWNMEQPDIPALAAAAVEILANHASFSRHARAHAETSLGLDLMTEAYLKFMLDS